MRLFTKFFLVLGMSLFVSGCETVMNDIEAVFKADNNPRQTVYYNGDPNIASTYPEMAREMSDGSVQIYNFDDPVSSPAAAYYANRSFDGGVPSAVDPNVTVYPFDNGSIQTPVSAVRPVLAPPSENLRPLQSPFNGPLQSPVSSVNPLRPPAPLPVPALAAAPAGESKSRIYYRHGSSSVDSSGKQVLDFVKQKGGKISVSGHASERAEVHDPVERSIVNLKMSMDRAFKVSSDLIRSGIPANQIETKAYGDTKPAPALNGVDAESASRRVEISASGNNVIASPSPVPPLVPYGAPVPVPLAPAAPQTRNNY